MRFQPSRLSTVQPSFSTVAYRIRSCVRDRLLPVVFCGPFSEVILDSPSEAHHNIRHMCSGRGASQFELPGTDATSERSRQVEVRRESCREPVSVKRDASERELPGSDRACNPLISVIATCFNHERYVEDCLESIRAQTYSNIELIVCDDASTDRSPSIIRNWVKRVGGDCRLLFHQENLGLCRTLNDALAVATGRFVALISTDDIWAAAKTEAQVRQFQSLPDSVGVLYSDALLIDEHGNLLPGGFIDALRSARNPRLCAEFHQPPEGNVARVLLRGNFIPAMTTLVRRDCFDRVGPYDDRLVYEDFDMWLRIAQHYEFRFSPGPLASYRVVPTSLARTMGARGAVSTLEIYQKWLVESGEDRSYVRDQIAHRAFGLSELLPHERSRYLRLGLSHTRRPRSVVRAMLAVAGIRVASRDTRFKDPHRLTRATSGSGS